MKRCGARWATNPPVRITMVLRPANIYGPRQSVRAVIPTIITQVLTQKEVYLGAFTPTRDFTYISDTVEAFIKIAETDGIVGQIFNIGSGHEISIFELAKRIAAFQGKKIEIISDESRLRPEKSEVKRLCSDSTKARQMIGWSPKISLDEGLEKTIDWISSNLNRYKIGAYII